MIAPPKAPSQDELELLIKEARARQLRRRVLGAAGVAIAAAIGLSVHAYVTGGAVNTVAPANAGRASGPLCRESQLSATTFLGGATGSELGGARITNAGAAACALPSAPPLVRIFWQGAAMPARQVGMAVSGATPVRVLAPGDRAFIYLQWRNWCGKPSEGTIIRPVFQLRFAGGALVDAHAQDMSPPRCDVPGSTIAVSSPLTG
jgi:Domain of unknown function (DUF4232)